MKTSYFSNPLLNKEQHYFVQISNSAPKGYTPDAKWDEAVPNWKTIVAPYKDGVISEEEYQTRYWRQLDLRKADLSRSLALLKREAGQKEIVLICYETPHAFCHRHILAKWLEKNGFETDIQEMQNSLTPSLF